MLPKGFFREIFSRVIQDQEIRKLLDDPDNGIDKDYIENEVLKKSDEISERIVGQLQKFDKLVQI
jgi:hypothetical protein